jgi:hypothetical protein
MYVNVIKNYVEAIIKCRYRLTYMLILLLINLVVFLKSVTSWLLWRTIGWYRGWRSLHHFRSVVQSPVTEHVFPSIKILSTNGTGDRVVVGFLV